MESCLQKITSGNESCERKEKMMNGYSKHSRKIAIEKFEYEVFVGSQIGYFPLVSRLHSRGLNNKVSSSHEQEFGTRWMFNERKSLWAVRVINE